MKRFYKEVGVASVDGGWQVTLDGRGIKTQSGNPQIVPSENLAQALANEWREQGDKIDPHSFIFRDHADFAIDHISANPAETIEKLLGYAETDTLCYRADPEDALFRRQQEIWEPLLTRVEERHGVRFHRISGIIHKAQPAQTLDSLRRHLETLDPYTLGALTAMASLAASLSIALLAIDEQTQDPLSLWRDANLEEAWQAELWGKDEEAEARSEKRWQSFYAAASFAVLARS